MEKTNVMRLLDVAKIPYQMYDYDPELTDGISVAQTLHQNPEQVFKTLVTTDGKRGYYVFVIPVCATLHLKKAAKAVGVKDLEMLKQRELLPLTGYVHGGCSPIGMKKSFPTILDETAMLYDTIIFSAGKRGFQVELNPDQLCQLIGAQYEDVIEG